MIEIKPAPRSNPDGLPNLPWNIWKDGRNTNVKPNKEEAERAAGIVGTITGRCHAQHVMEHYPEKGNGYFEVPRPRGAPELGAKIEYTYLDGSKVEARVSAYLSTQFIIEYETLTGTKEDVVHPGEDYKVVG